MRQELHSFAEMARATSRDPARPPNAIPAKALDENFSTCMPAIQSGGDRAYDTTIVPKQGWELRPRVPLYVCENGKPVVYLFMAQRLASED
jgi:hypothetical protein